MPYETELTLSKVEHGKLFPVATSQINDNHEFGFAVSEDKEGFYVLKTRSVDIPVYIKGGQEFEIKYSPEGYEMAKIPDEENKILYDWVKFTDTLKVFDFRNRNTTPKTYKDFFPFYEKFIPEMKKQHELVNSSNARFNTLMHTYIDVSIEDQGILFLFTPRSAHPDPTDIASYYDDFKKSDVFNTTKILDVPGGLKALGLHQMLKYQYGQNNKDFTAMRANALKNVENDTLRGYYSLDNLKQFKSYNQEYIDFIEPLRSDIALSDYVVAQVDDFEVSIKNTAPGTQGYPFTYKDINGKDVSFKDFRGKYVYIDLWATWCMPCKKEIPFLKQLEKDFHGKNIEFVSISLDKKKDYDKWLKFVKENELTGVQLFSDDAFNTRVAKDYKVTSIPRFLLFDSEGKIIDGDAKRPSHPGLKKQLEKLLK